MLMWFMVPVQKRGQKFFAPKDLRSSITQGHKWRTLFLKREIKDGELTGNWYQGSDYVVIDYFTLHNNNYGLNKTSGIAPYLYRDKWYTHYYDQSDKCERVVISKQIKRTQTMYDPEVLNARIVETSSRKELTKPDRYVRIKKVPQEIIDLIDRPVEVKDDQRLRIRT